MADEQVEESGFVGEAVPEGVGGKKKRPYVKKAGLTKAFSATPKDQLSEARDREVQLTNLIASQNKLIEQMTTRLEALEEQQAQQAQHAAALAMREKLMLEKTGVKKVGQSLYAGKASVTPPSPFNLPSLEPVLLPEDEEGEATTFASGWDGEIPFVVYNPHRMQVRIHDLKQNPLDKEDVGLLINPFSTVDLREYFEEAKIKSSRGLKHVLSKGILVAAEEGAEVGQPGEEPDSIQKRLAKAIGKVPRRGKIVRNPKTGKPEREQGINDPALKAAAEAHVQQETQFDKALAEEREYQESGSNIV